VTGDVSLGGSVGVHHPNVRSAPREGDLCAAGRPNRPLVVTRATTTIVGESLLVGSVGVLQVKQASGIPYGYVFPGAEDESGVCSGLEYIWTHGGDVFDDPQNPRQVIINSPETVEGLTTERSMIEDRVSPQDVASFMEVELEFVNGNAVFCRSWPWLLGWVDEPDTALIRDQVEVAPIPAGKGSQSHGCLGGWNLFINAASDADEQDAAWQFIQFLTNEANQKDLAIREQLMPARKALYEDPDVLLRVPIIPRVKAALDTTRARPTHPRYPEMSAAMAEQFNLCLKGQVSPAHAARTLEVARLG
jgi:multiple sugar transport system substrate-binding protein